ncbi:MAG: hypothetical protein ABMA00_06170 [Gemmatimonas sp.]
MLANRRNLIYAESAINEGGGGTLQDDKPLFHSVQASEKLPLYTLTVLNTDGHSSVPRKENAIYSPANAIARIVERDLASVLRADRQVGELLPLEGDGDATRDFIYLTT